uniref:Uncharacterized protein n=1 Tax=Mus musculus TaxID=10090 RepID=Q3V0H5_MOUSE|nr:unnamed protein product [Mus musculus]
MHMTEFAKPFLVQSDESLSAYLSPSSRNSTLLLLCHLGLHICHKSYHCVEPVFLLHHHISLLRSLRADVQHFTSPFSLHSSSSSKGHIRDIHSRRAERGVSHSAALPDAAPPPTTEPSGKFSALYFQRSMTGCVM